MNIDVTTWDLIRYLSLIVNGVILYQWLRNRLLLNYFLVGKWEGVLIPSDNRDDVIKCILYVAKHKNSDSTAHLYYSKKTLSSSEISVKGVDELISYPDDIFFAKNRVWKPKFMRVLHKNGVSDKEPDNSRDHPVHYDWKCYITSLFFNQKMNVCVKSESSDLEFSGTLKKV